MRDSAERPPSVSASPPADDLSSMQIDPNSNLLPLPLSKRITVPSIDDPDKPSPAPTAAGAPTYDGVIFGRVSGMKWKQPRKNRTSAVMVSATKKSYEERQKERELKKSYWDRKEEIRRNKEEKRTRTEEMKKEEENILRSGTKLQRISTLKKLAKSKQGKLLKVVPDEVLNKGKGKE